MGARDKQFDRELYVPNHTSNSNYVSGTYYSVQPLFPFIGATKNTNNVVALSPVTLTATGSDNRAQIDVDGMQQLVLFLRYTTGAAETNNVLNLLVDFSPDGTNFYQEASEAVSTTTITEYQATRQFTGASAATAYSLRVAIPIADVKKVRIAFSETGVVTNFGTLSCLAVTSGQ